MNNKFTLENSFHKKSLLQEAYDLLGVNTPLELLNLYTIEDQKLMESGEWDYSNPDLLINKIKNILEKVALEDLSMEEKEWRNEILWFWYHHAIGCAIWRYKDREKAKEYTNKALGFQNHNNSNQITKLFLLLLNNEFEEAQSWINTMNSSTEKETGLYLLEGFKKNNLFN